MKSLRRYQLFLLQLEELAVAVVVISNSPLPIDS